MIDMYLNVWKTIGIKERSVAHQEIESHLTSCWRWLLSLKSVPS